MAYTARKAEYFYTTINAPPDQAYEMLGHLAGLGINFLALTSVPIGPASTQLTVFPEDAARLQAVAKQVGLVLSGPNAAILVQGDDEIGALARIHERVRGAHVDVYATTCVTDGRGGYGYVLYVRPGDSERAVRALGA